MQDQKVLAALLIAAKDPSPLVRGAAVQALGIDTDRRKACRPWSKQQADDYRLVRVRAAAGIAAFPPMTVPDAYRAQLKKANEEYLDFIMARPDQWPSHYNMGNYQLGRGETKKAVASYQAALKLEPQAVMAMVNLSIAYARMGENEQGGAIPAARPSSWRLRMRRRTSTWAC